MNTMEDFPTCRVVLQPISLKSNDNTVNIKSQTPKACRVENHLVTPCYIKLEDLKKIAKNDTSLNKLKNVYCTAPCYVKLENIGNTGEICGLNDSKQCENVNSFASDTLTCPRGKFVCNTSLSEMKSPKYNIEAPTKFEPITPQAQLEFSVELKKVINERNILTSKTRRHVFEALDEIKTKTEEESRQYKRDKVLFEIINSETKYVHQLETILNFFMKPTKERKLLKPEDFEKLFGNINTIYNINKELLCELEKGCQNVSNAFSKIAPFFKLYSIYAYEFKSSLNVLQNARALNPQFAKFLENQETRPEVQNKLSALLITPIQRVPRYKLLLTNLYQLTRPSDKDFKNLLECLEKVENAAEHINNVVEEQENIQRLLELQRCLRSGEPNVITPGRKLIKEGILMKISAKNIHSEKLYVVLMNDIIMFNGMKRNELKVNSLKCLGIFPLSKCKVVEILDKGCFKIICQDEEVVLYHDQLCETKKWIRVIKESVDNLLNNRKTLRKESSSRRPVKRKDLHEYHVAGLSPGKPLKKRKIVAERIPHVSTPTNKILRRKPIHSVLEDSTERGNVARSLFSATAAESEISTTTENGVVQNNGGPMLSKDLYVFGRPNNNTGFRFGKFFGGVGTTIKKLLGFKNN